MFSTEAIFEIRDRAEALCAKLAEGPVHIVLQQEAGWLGTHPECFGFHSPYLHQLLRGDVGDRWAVDGDTFLINDAAIGVEVAGESIADFEREFLAIALHELAHAIVVGRVARTLGTAEVCVAAARLANVAAESPSIPDHIPPFAGHGAQFIRMVIHLAHRAKRLGVLVPVQLIFPGQYYSLFRTDTFYAVALGDEPGHLEEIPISEILSLPAPSAFIELFERDSARWFTDFQERKVAMKTSA